MTNCLIILLELILVCIENTQPQSPFSCGVQTIPVQELIVHGSDTVQGEWPWHAAIYHRNQTTGNYVCGGTLISEVFVLTAAHCVRYQNGTQLLESLIFVRLGVYDLDAPNSEQMQQHEVKNIHQPGKYVNETLRNDIAILELVSSAQYNNYVQPACVSPTKDFTEKTGTVVGWGLTEVDQISAQLKSAQMPVIDTLVCLPTNRKMFGKLLDVGIFCAGHTNGTTVCNGDSGGGLFFKKDQSWYLAGIVSFSGLRSLTDNRCFTEGYAGFTKVHTYLGWIASITKQHFLIGDTTSGLCKAKDAKQNVTNTNILPKLCGIHVPNRILNGKKAKLYEFPWMAMLQHQTYDEEIFSLCSGTLINNRYVLTAAYCTMTEPVKVTLGELTVGQDPDCQELDTEVDCAPPIVEYGIECITKHQKYNYHSTENNIALIRLDRIVNFADNIHPVCLPVTPALRNYSPPQYIVTGWGRFNSEIRNTSLTLRQTTVTAVNKSRCDDWLIYERPGPLTVNELCIEGTVDGDVCNGDEGGPLGNMANYYGIRFVQFGITSYRSSRCGTKPSVYTNISYHMDWIMANMYP